MVADSKGRTSRRGEHTGQKPGDFTLQFPPDYCQGVRTSERAVGSSVNGDRAEMRSLMPRLQNQLVFTAMDWLPATAGEQKVGRDGGGEG
ncbi:hypothetical protein DPEC_G00293440 [Dallia pectoralis]|uniref:Uncharacterized protein n=1 Tax=Dallia pectoralis TaxID=75939 RepID=A0ACC2FI88_DALPE|nr:hypothetical protein DPEC_G00293440 [Dallia pectoralis]